MAADDQLPPVQPPAASFFVQLFLIPMLIVSIIVGVWLSFSWLARSGTDPTQVVQDIERRNADSWRKALTLAQFLRDPSQSDLRNNTEIAGRLADLLDEQIETGSKEPDPLMLRIYLCTALGKFEIDTVAPALVKAATTENQVEDVEVRRAALQGIGTLAGQLTAAEIEKNPEMLAAVIEATDAYAEEGDERIRRELLRSTATYVLGVFAGEEATERLAKLLHDPSLNVGYNAAIGLARRGDDRALPLLAEMLDPPPKALIDDTIDFDTNEPNAERKEQGRQDWKRQHIVENALRAIAKMHTDHPSTDMGAIRKDVEAVSHNDEIPIPAQILAKEVLRSW